MKTRNVAVIGAGPAGLVAARYLQSEGFEPAVFEQGSRIGGQWSGIPAHSGVWPGMRTNTSRVLTAFSDLPHHACSPTYPTVPAMGEYLQHYAELFGLAPRVRLKTPVCELRRDAKHGYALRTHRGEERYEHVVIATGRYNRPAIPAVPGLRTFSGSGGVNHAFSYKHPENYRGLRVLVAGCSTSALEIASDLATLGAARVVATNRKQRYVLPKLVAGVPIDHVAFTRFNAFSEESSAGPDVGAALKRFVLDVAGSPEQFGAPTPAENIFDANIARSQHFLPLVAEGRITVKPWIDSVDGKSVRFSDGSSEAFDAMIFGTGYALHLPFLSEDIRRTLNADAHHLDLHHFTFHPDLPGLAFAGLFELVGPYFPVLELQGRWIAYIWSGARAAPSQDELRAGVAASACRQGNALSLSNHVAAVLFARAAGVEPELERWPGLARPLLFGPLAPVSFRMSGRDSLTDAPERFAADVHAFGCMPCNDLTPAQIVQLQSLAGARGDEAFRRYVAGLGVRTGAASGG